MTNNLYIKQTPSTNELIWAKLQKEKLSEGFFVYTDYQQAGKGQSGNSWESETGKNILFSMVLYPEKIKPEHQFIISQLVALAIKSTLDEYTKDISVKWPNDIYWKDKKIAGILIENSLNGRTIKHSVIGIGLNVNQLRFDSDAPNPVSLRQITGRSHNRKKIINRICQNIIRLYSSLDIKALQEQYFETLYRKDGFHSFRADEKDFKARIFAVYPDGRLELETDNGEYRSFYFKEVRFI